MFLPIGDEPNPRVRPYVTWLLIAANIAVWLVVTFPLQGARPSPQDPELHRYLRFVLDEQGGEVDLRQVIAGVSRYDLFVFEHGFRPAAPTAPDLLFSLFLHAGFLHLFGNMLFLWIYGDNVEARLGRIRYLLAYLGTGAAASLGHALLARGSEIPSIGASGAISGVLGIYFLWFPKNRVKVFVALFPFFMDVVRIPARLVLGAYLLIDNLLPFLLERSGTSGVAYGAHMGGFLAGLGIAALVRTGKSVEPETPVTAPGDPAAEPPARIRALVDAGRLREAAQLWLDVFRTPFRSEVDPRSALAIAGSFDRPGWEEIALATYRAMLEDAPEGPAADRAHLGAGLLLLETFGDAEGAALHLSEAASRTRDPAVAGAAREGLAILRRRGRGAP